MKQFLSFVRKEFYHILRDARTMMILLIMPIVQIILFGFAITTEMTNARIAVYDCSRDASTQQIIDRLQANEYFVLVDNLHSAKQIDQVLEEGKADMVVVFGNAFHKRLQTGDASVQLIADATDPNQATAFTNYASNIITTYLQENAQGQASPTLRIVPEVRMLYNPQMKGAYNFVPGVMGLILMLICAMMTSLSIVREKEMGTMEILLVSPVRPMLLLIAKLTPYFVLSVVNLSTILLLSVYVLHVPVAGSLFWLFVVSLLFIVVALSLGLLVSNLAQTQVAAMLFSGMALMMPTMLLSGLMFPIENMPAILQWIAAAMPVRWYIEAIRKLMIQGVEVTYVLKELAILSGMALLLLSISLRTFRTRLHS